MQTWHLNNDLLSFSDKPEMIKYLRPQAGVETGSLTCVSGTGENVRQLRSDQLRGGHSDVRSGAKHATIHSLLWYLGLTI